MSRLKRKLSSGLGSVAVSMMLTAFGMNTRADTLMESYSRAIKNDPTLKISHLNRDAAHAGAERDYGKLLPQISLNYNRSPKTEQNIEYETFGGTSTSHRQFNSYNAQISISQALYDSANWSKWKQADAQVQVLQELIREAEQDLILRTFDAYTKVLQSQDELSLAQSQVHLLQRQILVNENSYKHGAATRIDMAETESRYHTSQLALFEARDNLEIAKRKYLALCGESDFRTVELVPLKKDLADLITILPPLEDLGHWISLAHNNNSELNAYRKEIDVRELGIAREQAGYRPTVYAYVQHSQNKSDVSATYNERYRTNSIGINVSIPLYSGGTTSAAINQARSEHRSAIEILKQRRDEIMHDLEKNWRLSHSSVSRISAAQQAVSAAAIALAGSIKAETEGERQNLDVLLAAQNHLETRTTLNKVVYSSLRARLELKQKAGLLRADDLIEMSTYFFGE